MHTTQYAKSGDISIAYQVLGAGPDLVYVPGWVSNIDIMWEDPILASILLYAGTAETAQQGALLLLVYSLGLGIPFIGSAGPGASRVFVATGFKKWGMSTAAVAAMILRDRIGGRCCGN